MYTFPQTLHLYFWLPAFVFSAFICSFSILHLSHFIPYHYNTKFLFWALPQYIQRWDRVHNVWVRVQKPDVIEETWENVWHPERKELVSKDIYEFDENIIVFIKNGIIKGGNGGKGVSANPNYLIISGTDGKNGRNGRKNAEVVYC